MRRTGMLVMVVMAATLLAAGAHWAIVLAKNIDCAGGKCVGTARDDNVDGTTGNDRIFGGRGRDHLFGDPFAVEAGDDEIRGGAGDDLIVDSSSTGEEPDTDAVFGGKGNDQILVREGDGTADIVDCGPGQDTVFFDVGFDKIKNCENKNPGL